MTNQDKNENIPVADESDLLEKNNDESNQLNKLSKVNPDKKISLYHGISLVVLGVVVIAIFLSMLLHPKKEIKLNDDVQTTANFNQQLAENMAALRKEQSDLLANTHSVQQNTTPYVAATQVVSPDQIEQDNEKVQQEAQEKAEAEREWQARLNAPTSLLSGTNTNASSHSNTNQNTDMQQGAKQPIFSGSGADSSFGNQNTGVDTVSATKITNPDYTIASGELIQANLETPIDSDLPGMVRAVVSQPVYAYTGNTPLIPAGSRLIGQYSSGIVQGQNRVMVVWNRVILPNGVAAQLNSPGTDNLGISGQGADSVNNHFWSQFGEATFLSILSAGSSTVGVSSGDEYNSASQYRMAVSDSLSQTASQSMQQNGSIRPTLKINQGAQINIFVSRDVDFSGLANIGGVI